MDTVPISTDPVVRAAVSALDLFGVTRAGQARTLLSMWMRRDELTPDGLALVLAMFDQDDQDDQDDDYQRDDQEDGRPLPRGVEGWQAGGRSVGGRY